MDIPRFQKTGWPEKGPRCSGIITHGPGDETFPKIPFQGQNLGAVVNLVESGFAFLKKT